ncbi:MAG: hypothetical protein WCX63_03710 [Methanoregula sp.]|jgi:hypothetical protein
MKREDAVAPVIAAMLVLAVIVTFFAVWNATAIPAMKEQAEVSHLQEVESGILRFSSDIESAASTPNSMTLSERIPLGGGDVLFSSTKSGGMLAVYNGSLYMMMDIYNTSGSGAYQQMDNQKFRLANFSYQSSSNFWQDQGYTWSHGYVNVTKGTLATPLEFSTMSTVNYKLTDALFSASSVLNASNTSECTVLVLKGATIQSADNGGPISGNGIGALKLVSTTGTEKFFNVTRVNVTISNNEQLSDFQEAMRRSVNRSFNRNVYSDICENIQYSGTYSTNSTISLTIAAIPNVTVIRQTSDIVLSAQ